MGVPVRRAFLLRAGPKARSPLETLMNSARGGRGGGRGGKTRLALLLSLWWVNSQGDYASTRPSGWWAELIGTPGPSGARSVSANLHELERRGFITITAPMPGMPPTITLRNDDGTGQPYRRPDGRTGAYFRVPEELWTTAAISNLTGPGLAMYLIMLYHHRLIYHDRRPPTPRPIWFSARSFHDMHGLSEDTRLAGIQDLADHGIIHITATSIDTAGGVEHRRHKRRLLTLTPAYRPPLPGINVHLAEGSRPRPPS